MPSFGHMPGTELSTWSHTQPMNTKFLSLLFKEIVLYICKRT